jgi:coproporphyrinogen III oxidase
VDRTGLVLDVEANRPDVPGARLALHHVRVGADPLAPSDRWFEGHVVLRAGTLAREDADDFGRAWLRVCARHPAVAGRVRFEVTRETAELRFDALREDPEGAFHFVREVARAFLPAYTPLVLRHRP